MIIAIAAAAIIITYFILTPDLQTFHLVSFFSFWLASFMLDVCITLANKHLMRYEQNIILPTLIKRFGAILAAMTMFIMEFSLMSAISLLFIQTVSIDALAVIAFSFGVVHSIAFISNIKFVKKMNSQIKQRNY